MASPLMVFVAIVGVVMGLFGSCCLSYWLFRADPDERAVAWLSLITAVMAFGGAWMFFGVIL